jgi:hypothetical protein
MICSKKGDKSAGVINSDGSNGILKTVRRSISERCPYIEKSQMPGLAFKNVTTSSTGAMAE